MDEKSFEKHLNQADELSPYVLCIMKWNKIFSLLAVFFSTLYSLLMKEKLWVKGCGIRFSDTLN